MLLFLFTMGMTAQTTYRIEGNTLVSNAEAKIAPQMTQYTLTIDNTVYRVYLTSKGRYFINKVSKKTGKTYKQYLKVE